MLQKINDNAYKIDLPGEYNVSATFNVADLSPFEFVDYDKDDSRTNSLQERNVKLTIISKLDSTVSPRRSEPDLQRSRLAL